MMVTGAGTNATILNSQFVNNKAEHAMYGAGGALYLNDNATVLIEDCAFAGNHCNGNNQYAGGGALSYSNLASLTVRRSIFTGNTSFEVGGAVIGFGNAPSVLFENCLLNGNATQ